MKLTPREQSVCCVAAMTNEPLPYEVVVIPGESPPEWQASDARWLDLGKNQPPTRTEIRITVGEGYMKTLRAEAAARDKIR